jgi:hypothetical protein
MTPRIAVCFFLGLAVATTALAQQGVKYQPMNVKTGLWETTVTYKMNGNLPVPQSTLERMTPEQRARMQARMNANSTGNGRTETNTSCVTKQDLEKPIDFSKKDCTWTILESTSTRAKGNVSCQTEGTTISGNGEFEALDSEHIRGSEHMTSNIGGNKTAIEGTFNSKWLGANCTRDR